MIATRRLLAAGGLLVVLGSVIALFGMGYSGWIIAASALAVAIIIDSWSAWTRGEPVVERNTNASLALGVEAEVELLVVMDDERGATIEIFDGVPPELGVLDGAIEARISPGNRLRATYAIRPWKRGAFEFAKTHLRVHGPLGLVARQLRTGAREKVRVVPNFRAVSRYALMAVADKMGQMGVRQLRRRGSGMEFDCLREYREGDQLRQIDWKATARHRRLIARQYEDEKNQQIVLVFDCGRRMRARDGELSHFDHALNAGLLLSYVALKQGDSVSVGTFGGSDRWIPTQRGPRAVETIVEQTFDLEPTMAPSDFTEVARRLSHRQKRRALVVFLTNVYDADSDELQQALALLGKRHLVMVASLREAGVEKLRDCDVRDLDDALQVGATHHFLEQRRQIHEKLQESGGLLLDVTPENLSVNLVNRYLEIKRAGRL